jgi:hypothetical protein
VQSLDAKARIQNKTSLQRQQEIADAQEKTANAAGKTTEELTDAQLATAGASKDLQSLGFSLATYAVPAVNKFATALQSVTSSMNKYLGVGGTTSTPAGVDRGAAGGPRAGMSDSERILATIRQRESGGNYTAQAKGSSASGAYQFIDSTWQNLTKKYGIGQEFGKAKLAPKEIQDAIAQAYVKDILKEAGGDVSKVPLAWYTGNIQGKISQSALAANSGLTPETYQSKWMGEYNKMPAGPGGSYSSSMSGVSYNSAGSSTQAQANANSEEVRSVNPMKQMITLLTELVRTEQQATAYQRQILQNSKA